MKQRTRMLRVWGCLIIAMTGGSGLLAWLAPRPAGHAGPSWDECLAMARDAVASRSSASVGWRGVTLIPQPGAADRIQLAAVAQQSEAHFTVGRDGAVRAHPIWIEQLALDESLEVRVALPATTSAEIAQCQVDGLRALLAELRGTFRAAGVVGPLPVHVDRAGSPQMTPRLQAQLIAAVGRG